MPVASHPQAKFDPIPPDLDLHELVQNTPNFEWATQISASEIYALGQQRFEKLVTIHVINGGKPLVIKNWHERLPRDLFSAQWLEETYNRKEERVWDINNKSTIPMTTGHYLRSMKQLTDQWTPRNFRDERRQRLYLKDIDCPPEWLERLTKVLPRSIFYLNEDVEGGQNSSARRHHGLADEDDMFVDEHPAARAGDLMSSLPPEMRAENLMCYIGHEGTYTPAHREMCASLGQNIMVETSGSDNGEKPGSSVWFMTETKDREVVGEYFLSMLGHDVEIEKHFAQINAWKKAAFPVYIVEQKLGDLILVPPLAPHQVWNRGTRTMKVAWNRTVVETLELALREALPKARLVCRDEQYKNKAIIYYTLKKYYTELEYAQADQQLDTFGISQDDARNSMRTAQVADDFKKLLRLYTDILVDEMFSVKEKSVELIPFDSYITCSYCRANVFNRFLTCKHCVRPLANGEEDTYDVCMECYAMGRSCMCVSGLSWCEQWPWEELVDNYDRWQAMVVSNDGFIDAFSSPPPLEVARLRAGRKPVAQICQEQLRRRPFRDITKPAVEEPLEPSEPEVDDNGIVKKKKTTHKRKKGDNYRCHVCCHKDHRYRLAFCNTPGCQEAYCYGVLYRGFDTMPQTVMQQAYWKCPRCMKICNCGQCRKAGISNPYIPKGTLLGHDTRPIADDRSVESLINFRLHNLLWLKNSGDESRNIASKRMQRLRQQADAAKAQDSGVLGEGFGSADAGADASAGANANGDRENGENGDHSHDGGASHDGGVNPLLLQNDHHGHGHDHHDSVYPELGAFGDMGGGMYPDPTGSMMMGDDQAPTAFGQAYYMDDDDMANKILFDPYQEPPPNPAVGSLGSMATLPEFLESYTHRPVRRPRQEKDLDPDYEGPKPSHRKKPAHSASHAASQAAPADAHAHADDYGDPNLNVDPALLSVLQTTAEPPRSVNTAPAGPAPTVSMAAVEAMSNAAPAADTSAAADVSMTMDGAGDASGDEDDEGGLGQKQYPANVPELRHAKPKISYLEEEVASDGELDEDGTKKKTRQRAEPPEARALEGVVETVEAVVAAAPPAEIAAANILLSTPSSPSFPELSFPTLGAAKESAHETPKPLDPARKRGRPSAAAAAAAAAATPPTSDPPSKRSRASAAAPKVDRYGRSTASVSRAAARKAASDNGSSDSGRDGASGNESESGAAKNPLAKRRGRPPKSAAAAAKPHTPGPAAGASPAVPAARFLSMAERMALRGKKFKMAGGRRSSTGKGMTAEATAEPASNAPKEKDVSSFRYTRDSSSSDSEAIPSRTSRAVPSRGRGRGGFGPTRGGSSGLSGPTVVRLASSGSEAGSGSGSGSGSDSESVPSKTFFARRGGTRGRGRGRGRVL